MNYSPVLYWSTSSRENMHQPNQFSVFHLYVVECEQDIVRDHVNRAHRQVDFQPVEFHLDVLGYNQN
jgi:hypothetical protein